MGVKTLADLQSVLDGTYKDEIQEVPTTGAENLQASESPKDETKAEGVGESTGTTPTEEPKASTQGGVAEEYVPNFSYKVKGVEKTFDDRFKDIIKSKEDEEYIRQLYTKADGLEETKVKIGEYDTKVKAYEGTIAELQQFAAQAGDYYSQLDSIVKTKDFHKLKSTLGLSDDDILDYTLKILKEQELPTEQRAELQRSRELQLKQEELYRHNQMLAEGLKQYENQFSSIENDRLAQEQTNIINGHIGSKYADLNGKLNAAGVNLFNEIVEQGRSQYLMTGKEPDIASLVDGVASKYVKLVGASAPVEPPAQQQQPVSRPASIPKLNGDSGVQVGKKYTSLDQLKADFEKQYGKPTF